MQLSGLKASSFAAASLYFGIVINLNIPGAILAYKIEALNYLIRDDLWIALLTSLTFFVHIVCMLGGSIVGVVSPIVSLIIREGKTSVAAAGLFLNAVTIVLLALKFLGLI
jgi:hypothetical protein